MRESYRHHFVPQVYLRFFAKERETKKGEYYLYVYDTIQDKTFPSNVKDIGYKNDYNRVLISKYLPPVPDGNELYYEKKFQELIENDWNSIVHQFTAACTMTTSKKKLSYDMKFMLAKLIIIQSLRTPDARKITRSIGLKRRQELFDELNPIIQNSQREDFIQAFSNLEKAFSFDDEHSKSFHLWATTDNTRIDRLAKLIVQNRIWMVYRSPDIIHFPFITSDNPVVFYDPTLNKYGIVPNGIDTNTTIIGFPVTPQYYIITYHKKSPLCDVDNEIGDECVTIEPEIIRVLDRHQTNQCYRQVYIPTELGESMMKEKRKQDRT